MSDLKSHIDGLNAEQMAWKNEDPENRCVFLVVDDMEFWEKQGITTVAEFEADMAAAEASEKMNDLMYG